MDERGNEVLNSTIDEALAEEDLKLNEPDDKDEQIGNRKRKSGINSNEAEFNNFPNYFYSGFFIRVFAFLLDTMIAAALGKIVVDGAFNLLSIKASTNTPVIYDLLKLLVFLLYFVIMTYATNGQTLGKMIFGIRVVSFTEPRLKLSTVIVREFFGRFIYTYGILGLLYLTSAITPKKQHIVDMMTDTSVLNENTLRAYEERPLTE